jgi:opacity protein-like surface antigen
MDVVKDDLMRVTLALDGLRPSDNTESVNVGAEVGVMDMFFLRAGYKSLFANEPPFGKDVQQDGLTFGAGLKYSIDGVVGVEVNYAFQKFGLFGNLNTIALSVGF